MSKIPRPGPAASIVVPTNNRAGRSPDPVYPFAALQEPAISKRQSFGQTEFMLRPDSPPGFFRPAHIQGVLSE